MPGARSGSEEPRHHESGPGPEVRTGTPLSALTVANVRDLGGIPLVHAGADRYFGVFQVTPNMAQDLAPCYYPASSVATRENLPWPSAPACR